MHLRETLAAHFHLRFGPSISHLSAESNLCPMSVPERLINGGFFDGSYHALLKQIAFTSNLSDIEFCMEHELDGKWVKAVKHDKQSVLPYLAPFTFNIYTENNKLYVSTRYSYLAYSDSIFGYEVHFPKFSQSDVDYYGLASERELNAYPDYELFRKNIVKITKPFCFRLNGDVKKTQITITKKHC